MAINALWVVAGMAGAAAPDADYGKLPLSFEENRGQTDATVKYLSHGRNHVLFITPDAAVLTLMKPSAPAHQVERKSDSVILSRRATRAVSKGTGVYPERKPKGEAIPSPIQRAVLRMELVGANPAATVTGLDQQPGRSNYIVGNDPKGWHTNIPNFGRVKVAGVYPGIDVVYHGSNQRQLEYDFVVAPGADPKRIRLHIDGADSLAISHDGDLLMRTSVGDVIEHAPVVYQEINGARHQLNGRYVLHDKEEVTFKLRSYDKREPLIIDPVMTLGYSTYFHNRASISPLATETTHGNAVAVDQTGEAYVVGSTYGVGLPAANSYQSDWAGGEDAFVAKFSADGTALGFSTYLGGAASDYGNAIALDSSGNAYVTGTTYSPDFPTLHPFQNLLGGNNVNAFVAKFSADGMLVFSTYLGGSGLVDARGVKFGDYGNGIAVDANGSAYVVGRTDSSDFPTKNPFQAAPADSVRDGEAFVTKFSPDGRSLIYSTYLGGDVTDEASAVSVDAQGDAYVTGDTDSDDFPLVNAFQTSITDKQGDVLLDAFVSKFSSDGSSLIYSTYLGGATGWTFGLGIAVDAFNGVYVTGETNTVDFPTTKKAFQRKTKDKTNYHGFITKFNADGRSLTYSSYIAGTGGESCNAIAIDAQGEAYVTGQTFSDDFPLMNPFQSTLTDPNGDAFVSALSADGSALVLSTYLAGTGQEIGSHGDIGNGIAVDGEGNIYVAGSTDSLDFPTQNPFQTAPTTTAAFLTKFIPPAQDSGTPKLSGIPKSIRFVKTGIGAPDATKSFTIKNRGNGVLTVTITPPTPPFSITSGASFDIPAGGAQNVTLSFAPTALGASAQNLAVASNDPAHSSETIALKGTGVGGKISAPKSLNFQATAEGDQGSKTLSIKNKGKGILNISGISLSPANDGSSFQILNPPATPLTIAPQDSQDLMLSFSPAATGDLTATLVIASDDPKKGVLNVKLKGKGL